MWRSGALIAPVVGRMAVLLKTGSSRLHADETTAAVLDPGPDPGLDPGLDPGRGRTKTGYLRAVLRDGEPLWRRWFAPNGDRPEWSCAARCRLPLPPRSERRVCRSDPDRLRRHHSG
jgi:hypothetical protein